MLRARTTVQSKEAKVGIPIWPRIPDLREGSETPACINNQASFVAY